MYNEVLNNPIFRVLPEESIVDLLKHSNMLVLAPGEFLIKEGEFNSFLYVLTEGKVRVITHGVTKAELNIGDIVGEISTMGISAPVADVIALGIVIAIAFPIETIIDLGTKYPEFADQLRTLCTKRIY